MKLIPLIIILLSSILLKPTLAQSQDSTTISSQNFREDFELLKKEMQKQIEVSQSLLDKSNQNFDLAANIINWSAMFFAALTLILIIAGAVGLKEFSNIRKIESEMQRINETMKNEIESLRKTKDEIQNELNHLRKNIEKDSRTFLRVVYLLNDGISCYHTGDLPNAIDAFKKVLQIYPNDYEATCYLARSYIGQENYDLAITTAELALALAEKPARAYAIIGEAYRRKKRFDSAIEAFKKSVELQKISSRLNNLGYAYFKSKDYDNALSTFRESLEIKRNSTACCGLAKAFLKKQNVMEAHKYFQETIVLAEEDILKGTLYVWPYYNLAFSYLVLNRQEECLNTLKNAFEKNRNPSVIKEQLIDYKEMKGDDNVPQDLLAKCLDLFDKTLYTIIDYRKISSR